MRARDRSERVLARLTPSREGIEHEAWNLSGELRAVLLFDIWRPESTLVERDMVSAVLQALGSFGSA
ncbi:MAG: hypothetical protein ACRED9_06005 [Caulobacteraceae bacterium]